MLSSDRLNWLRLVNVPINTGNILITATTRIWNYYGGANTVTVVALITCIASLSHSLMIYHIISYNSWIGTKIGRRYPPALGTRTKAGAIVPPSATVSTQTENASEDEALIGTATDDEDDNGFKVDGVDMFVSIAFGWLITISDIVFGLGLITLHVLLFTNGAAKYSSMLTEGAVFVLLAGVVHITFPVFDLISLVARHTHSYFRSRRAGSAAQAISI